MATSLLRNVTMIIAAMLPMAVSYAAPHPELQKQQQSKPLSFIENKGQIIDQHGQRRNDIDYKLETPGMSIFVGNGQLHYQWYKAERGAESGERSVQTKA